MKKKKQKFERLTRGQKAVAIAQDVIAQINREVYVVEPGTYADLDVSDDVGKDLQSIIKRRVTKKEPCAVCAIGSCFISGVGLFDEFKVTKAALNDGYSETIDPRPMRKKLQDFFNEDDLWMLEICFELDPDYVGGYEGLPPYDEWHNNCGSLSRFLIEFAPEERLLWLMNVIVSNKGQFNYDAAKRAALVTLGSSVEERWVEFRKVYMSAF